jgi:DtxR family Mn-dependent transcriptional regulator
MILAVQPGIALLAGIGVIFFLGLIFWPNRGLIPKWIRSREYTTRILLEDALKFIFDCEYKSLPCGLHSIAGNLNISSDRATKLLNHLQAMGLVSLISNSFCLSDAGRSYALRVIRVHRIWERYLADETGLDQMEWHGAADTKEHKMTLKAADELAAQIGNPVYDPHGDPIPTSSGDIPSYKGQPLSSLREGDIARILHIEDEPPAIYAQLVALNLYPGQRIYVIDVNDSIIKFVARGEECVLTSLFASSITVEVLPTGAQKQHQYALLSSLEVGKSAEIVGVSPQCRGQERRRLMDLGVIPGTRVMAVMKSPLGDPIAFQILGATIAIRKAQANNIFIKPHVDENE